MLFYGDVLMKNFNVEFFFCLCQVYIICESNVDKLSQWKYFLASSVGSLFTFTTFKSVGGGGGCVRNIAAGRLLRILHCHVYKTGAGLAILHMLILL